MSAELKNALKYLLIWGMILIFSAYLLSDSEILGNVKQQARPDTWSMIGVGGCFEEEFTCKTNRLSGVELFLSTESASVAGTFQVTLYQNDREIQSWQASRLTISSGDTTYFRLDQKLTECKGQKFRIVLDGAKGDTGVAAGLVSQKDDTQTLAYRIISSTFPKSLVFLVIGAAAAVMLVIFAFLKRRQLRAEVVFAVVYIFMSICTLAAVPAFNSPDEYSHYLRSYEVSRGYLTSEGNGGNDLFSYGRTFNSGLVPEFTSKDHVSLWDIGENADQHIDREKTQFTDLEIQPCMHLLRIFPRQSGNPRIADLFYGPADGSCLCGKDRQYACVWTVLFLCHRLTPVGKNFLVLLGLVPVNIQSANSMSADALALALTVALAAFVLAMRYKQKEVMSRRQLIWMYVLTGFLCLCKVVYMPFCLLLFLIPKERFKSRKNYWFHVVCAGAVILILSFGWLAIASRYLCESQPGVDTAAQLVGILKDPAAFVLTFVRSLDNFGVTYLTEMIGSNLGWLNIPVCALLAMGYLLVLVLQVSGNDDMSGIRLDLPVKSILGGVSLLVFALIFVTLYGQWTAYGYDKILGVQGRYFLPLLFPLILALKPKRFAEGAGETPWGLFLGAWSIDLCVYATLFVQALCRFA